MAKPGSTEKEIQDEAESIDVMGLGSAVILPHVVGVYHEALAECCLQAKGVAVAVPDFESAIVVKLSGSIRREGVLFTNMKFPL